MPDCDLRPQVVELTPAGRGAIATLLVEGAGAVDAVEHEFRPAGKQTLRSAAADRPIYGRFGPPPGEEIVARRTGDATVEIHCHGGSAAVARIVELLAGRCCATLGWREWMAQQEPDPLAAAARIALADARTARTAAILLDQYAGALRRAVDEIGVALDRRDLAGAERQIAAMLQRARLGRRLIEPWRVVVAGAPNVGKSSLVNALLGYGRAIVHPTPGTTRDLVTALTVIDGWPVQLIDTAGLRDTADPLEQSGIELACGELATADLALLVFDGAECWSPHDQQRWADYPAALVVHNKSDLPRASDTGERPPGLWASAASGQNLPELLSRIVARLVPDPPPAGGAVPFTAAQVAALETALAAIVARQPAAARAALP